MRIKSLPFALVLSTVLLFPVSAQSVETSATPSEAKPSEVKPLSDEEFALQKEVMLKDLSTKIEVLQEALKCAKSASTSAAFTKCNETLRANIVAKLKK